MLSLPKSDKLGGQKIINTQVVQAASDFHDYIVKAGHEIAKDIVRNSIDFHPTNATLNISPSE